MQFEFEVGCPYLLNSTYLGNKHSEYIELNQTKQIEYKEI